MAIEYRDRSEDPMEFRGIEFEDGEWKAIYYSPLEERMLLTMEQVQSDFFKLQTKEGALHALKQAIEKN